MAAARRVIALVRRAPATAAAAGWRWTPAAAAGRWTRQLQIRRLGTSTGETSGPKGTSVGETSGPKGTSAGVSQPTEFVKNVKDIFSVWAAEQEMTSLKELSTTVYKIDEKLKSLFNSFWITFGILLPSSIAVTSFQYSQKAELKRINGEKAKLDTKVEALEKRVQTLELTNEITEKFRKAAVCPEAPATPLLPQSDADYL